MALGKRLKQAREEAGLSQEQLAERIGWSQAGIGALEKRDSRKSDWAPALVDALGVNYEWLVHGRGPKHGVSDQPVAYSPSVPLLGWEDLTGSARQDLPGVDCPFRHSNQTIALIVTGDAMAPDYRDGEIIFVDPEEPTRHNVDIVALNPDGNATFRRLQITPDGRFMVSLNQDWPRRAIELEPDHQVIGVVIGSIMDRRK